MNISFNLLQVLKDISSYTIPFMAIIACLGYVIKPIRSSIITWINKKVGTSEQNKEIEKLKIKHDQDIANILQRQDDRFNQINDKLDFLIKENQNNENRMNLYDQIHIVTLRNRIVNIYYKYLEDEYLPSFEKKLLMEHYNLYKNESLKGNGYIDEMYKFLMSKKERAPQHIDD